MNAGVTDDDETVFQHHRELVHVFASTSAMAYLKATSVCAFQQVFASITVVECWFRYIQSIAKRVTV